MAGRVEGKRALVTGGAQGLGEAIARRLAEEGARVGLSDLKAEQAQAVADDINARHGAGTAFAYAHDVADEAQWAEVVRRAAADLGGLSVLVNNAGVGTREDITDMPLERWRWVMGVNVDGVFLGCKHAIPVMKDHAPGSIINMASIAGVIAQAESPAYNASKAAVTHLTKSVGLFCAKKGYGIRCNSVHPAFTDTPILDPMRAMHHDVDAKLARAIPLQRLGRPQEIAEGVLWLASDESSFMTAAELRLDGGISAA
ncbi:MAG: glucose 1-dehydrogenase [Caulobacteraceae bacterium]|nr:glucose 1-dehydrogenase [Caulobacter sp.]